MGGKETEEMRGIKIKKDSDRQGSHFQSIFPVYEKPLGSDALILQYLCTKYNIHVIGNKIFLSAFFLTGEKKAVDLIIGKKNALENEFWETHS